jgi:hypothetical protein
MKPNYERRLIKELMLLEYGYLLKNRAKVKFKRWLKENAEHMLKKLDSWQKKNKVESVSL